MNLPTDPTRGDYPGFWPGRVVDVNDPELSGRIRVRVEQVYGNPEEEDGEIQDDQLPWCLPCFPVSGDGTGEYHVPPVGAQVWVTWYGNDPEYPVWVGGVTPTNELPDEFTGSYAAGPKTRFIKTAGEQVFEMRWKESEEEIRLELPNGIKLRLIQADALGGPKVIAETPLGYSFELDEKTQRAVFKTPTQKVEMLEAPPGALTVFSPGNVIVQGGGDTTVQAGGLLSLLTAGGLTMGGPGGGAASGATNVNSGGALNVSFNGAAALTFAVGFSITAGALLSLTGATLALLIATAVSGGITIGVAGGTFRRLIDERFVALFDAHTHTDSMAGATSPPNTPLGPTISTFVTDNTRAN